MPCSRTGARGMQRDSAAFVPALCRGGKAAPLALHESKGIFSFAKENIPFGTPRERLDMREAPRPPQCWPTAHPKHGLPRLRCGSTIGFSYYPLFAPLAALRLNRRRVTITWGPLCHLAECGLISVSEEPQCSECSNVRSEVVCLLGNDQQSVSGSRSGSNR